jgi:hypothetical protein
MVNSINSAQTTYANEAVKSAPPKAPQQPQQKPASQVTDTVSLKSTGDVDTTATANKPSLT